MAVHRQPHGPSRLASFEGRRPLGDVLHHQLNLLHWLCHGEGMKNIVSVLYCYCYYYRYLIFICFKFFILFYLFIVNF